MSKSSKKDIDPRALQIVRRLQEQGFAAYIVGGAARDLVMGQTPKDVDIATDARPEQVESLFERTFAVGAKFGVMVVVLDKQPYEVATFRSDEAYLDGRRPERVRYSSAEEDVKRRDFTINALMYDPISDEWLDFVGGRDDIANGIIRAIGDPEQRFAEDHLRMLRAVRFAHRFNFEIDEQTFSAIVRLASKIKQISAERIGDELTKILTGPNAGDALRTLQKCGLLKEILPEVEEMEGVEQPPQFHPEGDVMTHTCLMLNLMERPSPTLAWGVLLHDVGKPPTFSVEDRIRFNGHCELGAQMARRICQRFHFSNDFTERVEYLALNHLRINTIPKMRPARAIRFMREEGFPELLELMRLDTLGSMGKLDRYNRIKEMFDKERAKGPPPPKLISGHDLIEMGYKPGPLFSEILEAVEEEQLEGRLNEREDALEWVARHFEKKFESSPADKKRSDI